MRIDLQTITYGGWSNCLRLTNGHVEAVITTDVGPRILRYGLVSGENMLGENQHEMGRRGGATWRMYGGHRLWIAPEDETLTMVPDNDPVAWRWDGKTLSLQQTVDSASRIGKTLNLSMMPGGALILSHRLTNHGRKAVTLAPWTITVMAPGGEAILPQEPYRSHRAQKTPARPLVLWPYTNMADPRVAWGRDYIRVRGDATLSVPFKIGFFSSRGWMLYRKGDLAFIKYHPVCVGAHADYGCNAEVFTAGRVLELESLGPLVRLAPGKSVEHAECWQVLHTSSASRNVAVPINKSATLPQTVSGSELMRAILASNSAH